MTIILSVLLLLVFLACVGFLYTEGMWGNALRLINVVIAALLATDFFEPLASWLTEWQPTYTVLWDFLTLWGLFAVFMVLLRTATDWVSRVKVRFLTIADRIGSVLLAAGIGWIMVCFTLTTLHTAPLGKNFLFGAFQPREAMFFGMAAPDGRWLGFVQGLSQGAYCRSGDGQDFPAGEQFMAKYSRRRAALEAYVKKFGSLRVNPELIRPPAPKPPKPPVKE